MLLMIIAKVNDSLVIHSLVSSGLDMDSKNFAT